MVDQQRPRRPRPPRQGPPGGGRPSPEAGAQESTGGPATAPAREVAPWNYRAHLEEDHSMKVVPEEGWPTEYKRFALVKTADGKEKTINVFTGTLPQALQHFYRYVHSEPRVRRRRF